MLSFGKQVVLCARQHLRHISLSGMRSGSPMTVANVLPPGLITPTVDYLMSVERAAQLMAERHLDAVPVTKNDKVVGLFTERDYFDKVLNARHQATRSSMVCEVGTMGSELVVAHPDDTVAGCLEVMMKKNLTTLPVVEMNGQAIGTVSVFDLTRQCMEAEAQILADSPSFSEPAHFPENLVMPDGGIHDEETMEAAELAQMSLEANQALELELQASVDYELHERAAETFSEGSVFPEYSPTEEILFVQSHGEPPTPETLVPDERELRLAAAHAELLSHMETFSEPSDFPEAALGEEVIEGRAA